MRSGTRLLTGSTVPGTNRTGVAEDAWNCRGRSILNWLVSLFLASIVGLGNNKGAFSIIVNHSRWLGYGVNVNQGMLCYYGWIMEWMVALL